MASGPRVSNDCGFKKTAWLEADRQRPKSRIVNGRNTNLFYMSRKKAAVYHLSKSAMLFLFNHFDEVAMKTVITGQFRVEGGS